MTPKRIYGCKFLKRWAKIQCCEKRETLINFNTYITPWSWLHTFPCCCPCCCRAPTAMSGHCGIRHSVSLLLIGVLMAGTGRCGIRQSVWTSTSTCTSAFGTIQSAGCKPSCWLVSWWLALVIDASGIVCGSCWLVSWWLALVVEASGIVCGSCWLVSWWLALVIVASGIVCGSCWLVSWWLALVIVASGIVCGSCWLVSWWLALVIVALGIVCGSCWLVSWWLVMEPCLKRCRKENLQLMMMWS